jgi:hypothetical protein
MHITVSTIPIAYVRRTTRNVRIIVAVILRPGVAVMPFEESAILPGLISLVYTVKELHDHLNTNII